MTEQNADAVMTTDGIKEDAVKENFQRLNRIFKKIFRHNFGTFNVNFIGIPPSPQFVPMDWNAVGKVITLQIPKVAGTKSDTVPPNFVVPQSLIPKQQCLFPCYMIVNGTAQTGWLSIDTTGLVVYIANGGWAAGVSEVGSAAITYLGF